MQIKVFWHRQLRSPCNRILTALQPFLARAQDELVITTRQTDVDDYPKESNQEGGGEKEEGVPVGVVTDHVGDDEDSDDNIWDSGSEADDDDGSSSSDGRQQHDQ